MSRRHLPISLQQATRESPTLARLAGLAAESVERLKLLDAFIPSALRSAIQAGPIEGTQWCLLVDNNAVAAKIRQLQPALELHLRSKGFEVNAIRLKVKMSRNPGQD